MSVCISMGSRSKCLSFISTNITVTIYLLPIAHHYLFARANQMRRPSLPDAVRAKLRPVNPLRPVGLRFPALEFTALKIALRAALRSCTRGILISAPVRTNPGARIGRRCGQRGACSLLSCSLQEKTAGSTPTAPPRPRRRPHPR